MTRLLFILALLTGAALAQGGNTVTITASGAPAGACSYIFQYIDSATGNQYNCKAGAWNQIGGGGGSSAFSALTSSTNTTAAMIVGSGASLTVSGTGTIAATSLAGTESHTANNTDTKLSYTTCITSAHTVYRFDVAEIIPATNQVDIQVLFSTDGGSTYSATTYVQQFFAGVGGSTRADNVTSGTKFLLDDPNDSGIVNTANIGLSGTFTLFNPGGSVFKEITGLIYYERGFDGTTEILSTGGSWKTTTAVNAVRFQTSSGNLASGTITCTPVI
jgi:hypothetical protein